MSASVVKQIADLERTSMADLQRRWQQLIGTEPPRYNREFLIRRLAHRLQELAHGGLSQAARTKMDRLLEEAGYDEIGAERGRSEASPRPPRTARPGDAADPGVEWTAPRSDGGAGRLRVPGADATAPCRPSPLPSPAPTGMGPPSSACARKRKEGTR